MTKEQVKEYWERKFRDKGLDHMNQNRLISTDFLRAAKSRKGEMISTLSAARSIVEFGCGTGDLALLISEEMGTDTYLATDFSEAAVGISSRHASERLKVVRHDVRESLAQRFDLAISSNMLEHFNGPLDIVAKMLEAAPRLILIVPYREGSLYRESDAASCEDGSDNHVVRFDENSFPGLIVEDWFSFATEGWRCGLQMAVLLRRPA